MRRNKEHINEWIPGLTTHTIFLQLCVTLLYFFLDNSNLSFVHGLLKFEHIALLTIQKTRILLLLLSKNIINIQLFIQILILDN